MIRWLDTLIRRVHGAIQGWNDAIQPIPTPAVSSTRPEASLLPARDSAVWNAVSLANAATDAPGSDLPVDTNTPASREDMPFITPSAAQNTSEQDAMGWEPTEHLVDAVWADDILQASSALDAANQASDSINWEAPASPQPLLERTQPQSPAIQRPNPDNQPVTSSKPTSPRPDSISVQSPADLTLSAPWLQNASRFTTPSPRPSERDTRFAVEQEEPIRIDPAQVVPYAYVSALQAQSLAEELSVLCRRYVSDIVTQEVL